MDTPLIYTAKGNLPIDQLEYSTTWEDNDVYTKLTETYKLAGEVVRESVHVLSRKNLELGLVQGAF